MPDKDQKQVVENILTAEDATEQEKKRLEAEYEATKASRDKKKTSVAERLAEIEKDIAAREEEERKTQEQESDHALARIDKKIEDPLEMQLNEPKAPTDISGRELVELRKRSGVLIQQFVNAKAQKAEELFESLSNIGLQAQRDSKEVLELLDIKVGDLMGGKGTPGEKISSDIIAMRKELEKINPSAGTPGGKTNAMIAKIPVVGGFLSSKIGAGIEQAALRQETVSQQIKAIEESLREGQRMLRQDSHVLDAIKMQLAGQQVVIQKNAYLGEMMMRQLKDILAETTDPETKDRVRKVLFHIGTRTQDLRAMENIHQQYMVTSEMAKENNDLLWNSVERTITLATSVGRVGLLIEVVLNRQENVLKADQAVRDYIQKGIERSAARTKAHTIKIAELYKKPIIAVEALERACNDLIEAMDIADRSKVEGIEAATQNITKLSALSQKLEERIHGVHAETDAREEPLSIEAGEIGK